MNIRRLTAADANLLPQVQAIQTAAINAGTFAEWGQFPGYTRAMLAAIVADNDQRLFGAFDDTNALRGVLHARRCGIDPASGLSMWELETGIYDPTLTNLRFVKLYLLAVKTAAQAFLGISFRGSVVDGSTLDQLWNARFPQYRTVTTANGISVAVYVVPSDVIASTL